MAQKIALKGNLAKFTKDSLDALMQEQMALNQKRDTALWAIFRLAGVAEEMIPAAKLFPSEGGFVVVVEEKVTEAEEGPPAGLA